MLAASFLLLLATSALTDGQQPEKNLVMLAKELNLGTVAQLLRNAGLVDALATGGPFTVFAPTEAAFAKVPKEQLLAIMEPGKLTEVLKAHVVKGRIMKADVSNDVVLDTLNGQKIRANVYQQAVTISGVNISGFDNLASNGVIHLIDYVITPPTMNFVELAAADNNFSTMLAAVQTAELVDLFKGGPYTVFAPTNAAFEKLGSAAIQKLLANKVALAEILKYHVVPGTIYSVGMGNNLVSTLNGLRVHMGNRNGQAFVNFMPIYQKDVSATNGVVHVINEILLPSGSFVEWLLG